MKQLIIPNEIVTVDSNDRILYDHALLIENGHIKQILPLDEFNKESFEVEVHDFSTLTLIPGFVQTHVHLCQTLFRGLADDLELLDWLQLRIFPYENAHTTESLSIAAKLGINELQLGGTTTILDMGTVNHQEVIFDELIKSDMRAIAGKCLIDKNNLFPDFKETTDKSLRTTYELAKEYHDKTSKIKYGFSPRFVLSCSEELLMESYEMRKDFDGAMYHTHSSENRSEVEEVRKLTGRENIQYFNDIGLLSDHTVLAHCIHVNNDELSSLKNSSTRVAHCPSSNLKLGSGIANIPQYLDNGISVSLGADGAPCNNELNIFTEMRLASLIQKPIHGPTTMDAKTVFRLSNIEGAKALNLSSQVGSIEVGKKADLVFIDLNKTTNPYNETDESIYSSLVYSADRTHVEHVMIDGEFVVKNGKSENYDEDELLSEAKTQLKKLLENLAI